MKSHHILRNWTYHMSGKTIKYCNTLQHTATHCNTLQHAAIHCNTLQHTASGHTIYVGNPYMQGSFTTGCTIYLFCNWTLSCDKVAQCCRDCNWMSYIRTSQHTATHCNALQQAGARDASCGKGVDRHLCSLYFDRNMLQHTTTRCNTRQHTATHCTTQEHT